MAQNYIKIYLDHFNYGDQDFIPSELSGCRAQDIHHLTPRSKSGTDVIDNHMALTREEHDKAHSDPDYNEYLKTVHLKRLLHYKIHNG